MWNNAVIKICDWSNNTAFMQFDPPLALLARLDGRQVTDRIYRQCQTASVLVALAHRKQTLCEAECLLAGGEAR